MQRHFLLICGTLHHQQFQEHVHTYHSFIPVAKTELKLRRLSADEHFSAVTFGNLSIKASTCDNVSNGYQPGKYIACVYDQEEGNKTGSLATLMNGQMRTMTYM